MLSITALKCNFFIKALSYWRGHSVSARLKSFSSSSINFALVHLNEFTGGLKTAVIICPCSISGAVWWALSHMCDGDPVPPVSAEKTARECRFHWYLPARLRWSQIQRHQLWDGHGGNACDWWERGGRPTFPLTPSGLQYSACQIADQCQW